MHLKYGVDAYHAGVHRAAFNDAEKVFGDDALRAGAFLSVKDHGIVGSEIPWIVSRLQRVFNTMEWIVL